MQQEEGDKGHETRQSGNGSGGGGDTVGKKCNNQIDATTVVVGTVCVAVDSGAMRAKGKMSGWQKMQGNQVVEDATRRGVRQREAIRPRRMQREEGTDNARRLGDG
jgi:hypothetical protein